MSLLFPRFQEFSPFFRLADEIDRAARSQIHGSSTRSFAPRFDVKETKETYELYGELPGIDQSNVNIEWSDETTLTISGRSEKRVESTNTPEVNEVPELTPASTPEPTTPYHKPSVEDDEAETRDNDTDIVVVENEEKPVAKTEEKPAAKADQSRYWISERSYGTFSRTFHFASRVEHDAVKASLKNGVLSVVVPKAKVREPRRVVIN